MSLVKFPNMIKLKGFLDTEKKVFNAWNSLEKATETDFKKHDEAKRATQEVVQIKILD